MRKILIYIITSVFTLSLYSQSFNMMNYSSDEGLPYFIVYDVIQDSNGFMWFATDKGVSRFNGYEFDNFEIQHGLVENTIVEIYEDISGKIWFSSIVCKLTYFENNEIHEYAYNEKILENIPQRAEPLKGSLLFDEDNNLFYGIKGFGTLKIDKEGEVLKLESLSDKESIILHIIEDKLFLSYPNKVSEKKLPLLKKGEFIQELAIAKFDLFSTSPAYEIHEGYLYFSSENILFQIEIQSGNIIQKEFPDRILSINSNNDKLWVGLMNEGIFVLNPYDDFNIENRILREESVSSIKWDSEGGTWISTLDNGVFYILLTDIISLKKEQGLSENHVSQIIKTDNFLIVGYNKNYIDFIYADKVSTLQISNNSHEKVKAIQYDKKKERLLVSTQNGFYEIKDFTVRNLNQDFSSEIYPTNFFINRKNNLLVSTEEGFYKFDNNRVIQNSKTDNDFNYKLSAIVENSDGSIWLAGNRGLWKFYKGIFVYYGLIYPELSNLITDLAVIPERNMMFIGTNGHGLYIYYDNKLHHIDTKNGLSSNNITTIYTYADEAWVGTNNGLNLIKDNGVFSVDFSVKNYSMHDGLNSNIINDIFVVGDSVYVATNKGVNIFNSKVLDENKIPPKLYFTSIQINNQDTLFQEEYNLSYSENNLNIEYLGISYQNAGNILYKYTLEGLDTVWYTTRSRSIRYSSLPYGDFTFKVMARNTDGYWNLEPSQFKFKINAPFWKATWFIFAIFFGFMAIVITYIILFRKSYQRRINAMYYRQQVLRQQMNPHFIFNTLNSIQLYILEKNTEMSQKYLSKFSRLMRINLENSQYKSIAVEEEIKSLELYLQLEMLRFDNQISYDINIDEKDSLLKLQIPSLIIQPFVENSIWHGLTHKEEGGHVQINLKQNGNYVQCVVEDNGIGRGKAKEIKKQKMKYQKSYGISITRKRIELLNQFSKDNLSIKYFDLKNEAGEASGTRVEIEIPIFRMNKNNSWDYV